MSGEFSTSVDCFIATMLSLNLDAEPSSTPTIKTATAPKIEEPQPEPPPSKHHIPRNDEEVDYGAISQSLPGCGPEKYYITTAIAYTNGYPHIGHAYEFMTADILARLHRVFGYDVYFLTGSDEHGQKVANSAEKAGRTPLEHCDIFVNAFQALNQRLAVSNSAYLRTTNPDHKKMAQRLWNMCSDKGDIYLDSYEGWYNEREEVFVTETEAQESNFLDPGSGLPLKRVTEESYFFKMSKYCDALIKHVEENPSFIEPEQFRNNILARLRKEGLKDLSLSRTSFSWGIPVPQGFDQRHVMYVWFDALSNYISGVHLLEDSPHELAKYWPPNRQIIGKDIIWFHCVIWPCMLMSAGLPLPGGVFSHGFVNAADGRKMSKSYNNAVDPHEALDKFPLDSLRYYISASTTYGVDMNFNEATLITLHNSELADILGNLIRRAFHLCTLYCGGVIPDTRHDPAFGAPFDFAVLRAAAHEDAKACAIHAAVFKGMEAARATNKYLQDAAPWKMKGEDEAKRPAIVRTTLEAVYAFMHVLAPILPFAGKHVFDNLHTPARIITTLDPDLYNLTPGTPVTVGDILFNKIDADGTPSATSSTPAPTAAAKKAGGGGGGGGGGKEKKGAGAGDGDGASKGKAKTARPPAEKAAKTPKEKPSVPSGDSTLGAAVGAAVGAEVGAGMGHEAALGKINLRVGRIVKVWNHETADRLYCEEIDVGEEVPRPIASGLRSYYTLEQLQDRLVVVVCNLKEAKLVGFASHGMVLAAKSADESIVELVDPPAGSNVGDRVTVEGVVGEPETPARVKKLKLWEAVAGTLAVNAEGEACWQGKRLSVSGGGKFTVPSLVNVPIS